MKPFLNLGIIAIPTFYLVISIALSISLWFLSRRVEQNKSFERKVAFNLALLIMISGFLGARLFHVVYEAPKYYLQYPEQVFQFWNGGYVYFGGMLTALAASVIYMNRIKQSFLHWADFMAPQLSLMYALGRIGCFLEGCCYGKYCELPWAIHQRHPTQIYMSLAEFFTFFIIFRLKPSVTPGKVFYTWLSLHSAFRFIFEFFRDDERGASIANFFSISQILSLLVFSVSMWFVIKSNVLKSDNVE